MLDLSGVWGRKLRYGGAVVDAVGVEFLKCLQPAVTVCVASDSCAESYYSAFGCQTPLHSYQVTASACRGWHRVGNVQSPESRMLNLL
jgi:hypothetical protein